MINESEIKAYNSDPYAEESMFYGIQSPDILESVCNDNSLCLPGSVVDETQ
jgi:hypothetical protein